MAVEILVTYTRLPAAELYYVSGSGFGLATRQVLLFIGFPVGLVAVFIAGVALDRVSGRGAQFILVGMAGLAITALVGTGVDEVDADIRAISVLAVSGVALAAALCIPAARRWGVAPLSRVPGDRVRAAIAIGIGIVSIPWLFADLGFSTDQVAGLRHIFISEAARPDPGRPLPFSALHDGHHHDMDGVPHRLVGDRRLASFAGDHQPPRARTARPIRRPAPRLRAGERAAGLLDRAGGQEGALPPSSCLASRWSRRTSSGSSCS